LKGTGYLHLRHHVRAEVWPGASEVGFKADEIDLSGVCLRQADAQAEPEPKAKGGYQKCGKTGEVYKPVQACPLASIEKPEARPF
jgi:hypothetical protein